jgi:L-rhamnose mutarotase
MIKIQQENEEQWWKGRQDLMEKQKVRKEGQKKLDEVL